MKDPDESTSATPETALDTTEGDRALLSGALDALVALVPSDQRPLQGLAGILDWRFRGLISRLIREGVVTGTAGECVLLPWTRHGATQRVILLGIGKSERSLPDEAFHALSKNLAALKPRSAGLSRSDFESRAGIEAKTLVKRLKGAPVCLVK